jgi:serine/threonine protein phosphatase PrpC
MVLRQGKCIYKTFEQQHSFNFPFQLGTGSRDSPLDAVTDELTVQEGDILIMGTDGIWDNVFVNFFFNFCKKIATLFKF